MFQRDLHPHLSIPHAESLDADHRFSCRRALRCAASERRPITAVSLMTTRSVVDEDAAPDLGLG
jgi:hypothetical protein